MLEFLMDESLKVQKSHEATEAKTERFLCLFKNTERQNVGLQSHSHSFCGIMYFLFLTENSLLLLEFNVSL